MLKILRAGCGCLLFLVILTGVLIYYFFMQSKTCWSRRYFFKKMEEMQDPVRIHAELETGLCKTDALCLSSAS